MNHTYPTTLQSARRERNRPSLPSRATRLRPKPSLVLTEKIGVDLSHTCLFYPSAGTDMRAPLQLFLPYVSSFWLVDVNYRISVGEEHIRRLTRQNPPLTELRVEAIEDPVGKIATYMQCRDIPPFRKTATFTRPSPGGVISVHWCRHHGPAALRELSEPIGIFFYRGDGEGEGGSSIPWLTDRPIGLQNYPGQMTEVLDRLVDGGLIVTDGCNRDMGGSRWDEYDELNRFCRQTDEPAAASSAVSPFKDRHGHHFRCIGYLGRDGFGYGPTLIWQIRKSHSS